MRGPSLVLAVLLTIAVAGSCGGSAFSTGGGADGGGDVASGTDGTDDLMILVDGSSGSDGKGSSEGGDAASSGGGDATSTSSGGEASTKDTGASDAFTGPDVLEEPPPTCGGAYACFPAVPSGWTGPLELYAGSGPDPSCTSGFLSVYSGNDQLGATASTCNCSCTPPTAQCQAPTLTITASLDCPGVSCATANPPIGTCSTLDVTCTGAGMSLLGSHLTSPGPTNSGGTTCAPQPTKQIPQSTWGTSAEACISTTSLSQVNCQAGSVCAPKPAAPYEPTLCVSQTGNVPCPTEGYTVSHVYFDGVNDTRDCSACTCGALTGQICSASVTAYTSSNGSCTGSPVTYTAPIACTDLLEPKDILFALTTADGTCTPSQSTPTGSLTPSSPTTFCCTP